MSRIVTEIRRTDTQLHRDIEWSSRLKIGQLLVELERHRMTLLGYHTKDSIRREGQRYNAWYQHQIPPVTGRVWTVARQGDEHVLLVSCVPRPMRFWFEKRLMRREFKRAPA